MNTGYRYSKDGINVFLFLDRRRPVGDGLFPIKVRVTYRRGRLDFKTGKSVSLADWEKISTSRQLSIQYIRKDIENSFELIRKSVEDLASAGEFTLARLKLRASSTSSSLLLDAILSKVNEQRGLGRIGNAANYQRIYRNIERFAGSRVVFDDVTPNWLKKYEQFLRNEGKKQTTIAIEMRTLRAVFNEAIRNLLIPSSLYPFGKGKYEIQEGSGRKLALTIEQIGKIAKYETPFPAYRKHRDYWMFLYLCNGISVVDFCQLKYSDIVDGEIRFVRAKTHRTVKKLQEIRVVISEEMKDIIDKHGNISKSGYIFPILNGKETPGQLKNKTQHITGRINKYLKRISEDLGLPHVSTYTARHSFATVLKRAGVSIAYISESLGHSNLKTTENYLASFEREEREKNSHFLTQY